MTKKNHSLWAMAAGCVPDALPWDIPKIAHSAGFLSSGMWVDNNTTVLFFLMLLWPLKLEKTMVEVIQLSYL